MSGAELLVISNPNRKTRRVRRSKARRNPTARKMSAKQQKYFGKRRAKRVTRRRRSTRTVSLSRNPSPAKHRVRRRHARRNPMSLGSFKPQTFIKNTLVPAGIGAAGALAVDVMLGYAAPHLPAALTTGTLAPALTRIAAAVGLGMATQMVTKDRNMAEQVAAGAIIVTLYAQGKKMVQAQFPTLPLSGMGVYVHGMGYAGAARAFADPRGLGVYVAGGGGSAASLPPMVVNAMNRAAAAKNQAPVGLHGSEYQEGGYNYA